MGFREFLIELTGALIKEDCNKNVTTTNISLKYEIWDGYIKVAYFFIYTPYKKRSTYIRVDSPGGGGKIALQPNYLISSKSRKGSIKKF